MRTPGRSRWPPPPPPATCNLQDDTGFDILTTRVVALARQAGALSLLPKALDLRALGPGPLVPGWIRERAHALPLGACESIAVVVSSSRKPPDWCRHSLA
jgi:hypothetical protein